MDEVVRIKKDQISKMLATLRAAIELHDERLRELQPKEWHEDVLLRAFHDSMIQRFEYTIDGFWKFLRVYLEQEQGFPVIENGPKSVVRSAVTARMVTEQEADALMQLIKERNKTSHIYHEEIADEVALHIPSAHRLIALIADRLDRHCVRK